MKVTEMYAALNLDNFPSEGLITADSMCLAVDISAAGATTIPASPDPTKYVVVQMGTKSVSASLNADEKTNAYIRQGKSSTKVGTQRTFSIDADRYAGDEFQDFALSNSIKYGVGQAVVVPYLYFNVADGKGEKGLASIIVNSDGSGNAEENLGVSIDLKKAGPAPEEYEYTLATVSSIAMLNNPTKTTYAVGESLNVSGGQITATYSDSSTRTVNITDAMCSGFDSSEAGTSTVTVTYSGKTTTFDCTITGT